MKKIFILNLVILLFNNTAFTQSAIPKLQIANENVKVTDTIYFKQYSGKVETSISKSVKQYNADIDLAKVTIIPDDGERKFTINISNLQNYSSGMILVSNIQGKIIYQNTDIGSSNVIDVSALLQGDYILTVILNNIRKDWMIRKG